MEEFKNKPGSFQQLRKQILIRTAPVAVLAAAAGVVMSNYAFGTQENAVNVLPVVIPLVIILLIIGISRAVKQQKLLFESYTLAITENEITRQQANTTPIKIPFHDISEIIKNSNGSLMIKGRLASDIILVPAQIDNYDHLETLLTGIKPLTEKTQMPVSQKFSVPISILTIGLMAAVYLATNKILVGISGTLLSGFLIWSLIKIQQNKNIDDKTKRSSYWTIVVLISIIVVTAVKLFG